jgi:hypothetical protein
MNRDFRISLVPGTKEGELQVVLYSQGYPEAGNPIETARTMFTGQVEVGPPPPEIVDISVLGELRGSDGRAKVESAIKLVSQWVLGNDVRLALETLIANLPDDTKVRIIFSSDKRLRSIFDLTNVPVELMSPKGVDTPFAINPKVASILHLLDDVGAGRTPPGALDWPLRVLIVRSNPQDLGLAVPEAIPVAKKILGLGETKGSGAVVVDVISSEPAVGKPATWENFRKQLTKNLDPYDIVIYLGHGSLKEEGGETIGCLQFEDGVGHTDMTASDIIVPFLNKPVPVVLLVACQTADQVVDSKYQNLHKMKMPDWIRGSQGVAQALINSVQSGTQLVVGMRYRLDTKDAISFLENFFDSLLRATPGNVEAAVHLARQVLKTSSRFPAAFSGPMVFRSLRGPDQDEPLFAFIANKTYVPTLCQGPLGDWTAREVFWDELKDFSWSQRPKESRDLAFKYLNLTEERLVRGAVANAALILPDFLVGLPGEKLTFSVKLHGSLGETGVSELTGQLLFKREDTVIEKVEPSPELNANGYKLLSGIGKGLVDFTIKPTGDPTVLQNLTLFNVTIQIGQSFNLWFSTSVSGIQTVPKKIVCPGANAIIIPPP